MRAAVQRVQDSGDFNAYFRIRQDYELASQNKIIVSEQLIKDVTANNYSTSLGKNENPEQLEEAYNLWLLKDDEDKKRNVYSVSLIFNNPHTPKHILEDIAANVDEEQAERILQDYNRGVLQNAPHVSFETYAQIVAKASDYTIGEIISDNRSLTFEQKYALIKDRPSAFIDFFYCCVVECPDPCGQG